MLAALLLALAQDPVTAGDYFPTVAGTTYVYSQQAKETTSLTWTIKAPTEIDSWQVIPIQTMADSAVVPTTLYYRVASAGVSMFALGSDGHRASDPQPFFELGNASGDWTFSGAVSAGDEPTSITIIGKTKRGKPTKALGRTVDTIIVTRDSVLGNLDSALRVHQVLIFGKGVGLIEMNETSQIGKRKQSSILKLVEIRSPGAATG